MKELLINYSHRHELGFFEEDFGGMGTNEWVMDLDM